METPLRRVRHERGLTQEVVATAAAIKQGYYSRLETGENSASPEVAAKLAAFLGMDEREILYPERYQVTAPEILGQEQCAS